jgi:hypothetical protein
MATEQDERFKCAESRNLTIGGPTQPGRRSIAPVPPLAGLESARRTPALRDSPLLPMKYLTWVTNGQDCGNESSAG